MVTSAIAARDGHGWGLAAAFVAIAAFLFIVPWLTPRARETVQVDQTGVTVANRAGLSHVNWSDVTRISILTTSAGPYADDVYFVLEGTHGSGCVVPQEAAARANLLEQIQARFHDVDNAQLVAAMASTADLSFVIWEAGRGREG